MTSTTTKDPVRRAFAAWYRNEGAQVPSETASGLTTHEGLEYVVLRNVTGVLAVYRVTNKGQLKRLRRWPAALEEW